MSRGIWPLVAIVYLALFMPLLSACAPVKSAGSSAIGWLPDPGKIDRADFAIGAVAVAASLAVSAGLLSPAASARVQEALGRARGALKVAQTAVAVRDAKGAAAKLEEVDKLVAEASDLIAADPPDTKSPGS